MKTIPSLLFVVLVACTGAPAQEFAAPAPPVAVVTQAAPQDASHAEPAQDGTGGAAQETRIAEARPPAAGAIDQLASSAQNELARSIEQLNRLRDQIAEQKLPMAQELTALEEKLTRLRAEHDEATKKVDEGNLATARLENEVKARDSELAYVGNLLDEYARGFESKVNVSELQPFGEPMTAAKQAGENTTLSMKERFATELSFVDVTLGRLARAIAGLTFPGVGVSLQGTVVQGTFAILGPVALFRSGDGRTAGLAIPQSGSPNPLIRPLEGALQAGLAALVSDGDGLLPLDPSRGGALKALVQKTSLVEIFKKGGPIMWPLLIASILSLATVLERIFFLMRERMKRDARSMERFFTEVGEGDMDGAIRTSRRSDFFVVRALGYALSHKETSLPAALLYAQSQELKRFRRGIPILDTVITLAPLLGLLGTVTGMMGSFSLIGGELSSPGAITGGIAEALIATAFGLGIAITSLLPFNFLNARVEEARHELDSAATQLELLVRQNEQAAERAAAAIPGSRSQALAAGGA
jgi:biopolymer transport protein ExbB